MFVGILKIEFIIHGNDSLKGKRSVVNKIKERIKNNFNVSIAEVGFNDNHQRGMLGVSVVGNDSACINSNLNCVLNKIESAYLFEIINNSIEIMSV